MKTLETKNLIFEDYTNAPYFEDIVIYVENHEQEILDFFKLAKLSSKWKVKFLPFEDFKNYMIEHYNNYQNFMSANTSRKEKLVTALNVEDRREYTNHKDADLMQICKMLVHEFIHVCNGEAVDNPVLWFDEGLASYLSHQDREVIDVSNEDFSFLKNNFYDFSSKSYTYSYYIVKYLFEHYPMEEIQKLTFDKEYLISKTNDLFNETKKWTKEQFNN